MISVSGGRACRDRDGVARFVVRPVRGEPVAERAARLGRSMVCLRRGDSASSPSSSSGSPVNSDDSFEVRVDARLVLVDSFSVAGTAPRRDDMP